MGVMKTCTKCNESKPHEDFRLNVNAPDGYAYWCKKCQNRASELSKRKNKEAYRAKGRAKYARRMAKLHGEGYVVGSGGNKSFRVSKLDPETKRIRYNARHYSRRALAEGRLVKQPCFVCGEQEVEIHHPDYSRPLDVVWLCKAHHREVHS